MGSSPDRTAVLHLAISRQAEAGTTVAVQIARASAPSTTATGRVASASTANQAVRSQQLQQFPLDSHAEKGPADAWRAVARCCDQDRHRLDSLDAGRDDYLP